MPYAYQIIPVLTVLQNLVAADLTAQGETPQIIPFTEDAQSYSFDKAVLPLTLIEIGPAQFADDSPNSIRIVLSATIHQVRAQVSGQPPSGVTAMQRLAHIATTMRSDPRLQAYWSVGGSSLITSAIESADASHLLIGQSNPVWRALQASGDLAALTAVALPCRLTWVEQKT
jgi:hypothetical protein